MKAQRMGFFSLHPSQKNYAYNIPRPVRPLAHSIFVADQSWHEDLPLLLSCPLFWTSDLLSWTLLELFLILVLQTITKKYTGIQNTNPPCQLQEIRFNILLRRTTRTLFTNVGLCSWVRHFSLTVLSTPRRITAQIQEARRRESLETRSSKVRGNWGEMTSRWRLPPSYLNFIVIHERLLTALCLTRCFVCIIPLL